MSQSIRIGNQTAISCAERMGPFEFALHHGFDAFEWFADKKWNPDGKSVGWDESDMDPATRAWIRETGKARDILFTVHAPWQANPLRPEGVGLLRRSIDFARDIGADLVNLHLYMDDGATGYVRSLEPVIRYAANTGLRLSIENTPHTTPDDFNRTFARLCSLDGVRPGLVGMCLDIGHANLCAATRNDYLRFMDALAPEVPIIHLHVHENQGDADTHLTLFTGPSRTNDAGVRAFLTRMLRRDYRGALILEQWPRPPELLVEAATRLRGLLASISSARIDLAQPASADRFLNDLVKSARSRTSWRGRLQWVRDCLVDPSFQPTIESLATLAVYLRFLATGELKCTEDGGHFRPNHSAEAALQIETALERMIEPETAWILRRIYPYLPSWGEEFRRAEPLTRIRDIAHRNDIPGDLKREIKQRLQNKLHRCAGPEDLRTSEELLERITTPGTAFSPAFVEEFKLFHAELQEFFRATALDARLQELARDENTALAAAVTAFLNHKKSASAEKDCLSLLSQLTALRRRLLDVSDEVSLQRRSERRLADIGLEDYAFTLLSECANKLDDLGRPGAWDDLLHALVLALDNLRLSLIAPEECAALSSELSAWRAGFRPQDAFHLRRLLATLARARRLAEDHCDLVGRLFTTRAQELGRALEIEERAVAVFCEGEVRGHLVFQLARLLELGSRAARTTLRLPPWETVVPGEARGTLLRAVSLEEVESTTGPLLVMLNQAEGDAEIPAAVKGVLLGHSMPLLSHLGVRARQARVPFACCSEPKPFEDFQQHLGKTVLLRVVAESVSVSEDADRSASTAPSPVASIVIPQTDLTPKALVLPLEQATPACCGAKADGARRLLELAGKSGGLFRAPRGLVVPFGVMQRCLESTPTLAAEYLALCERLGTAPPAEVAPLFARMRELLFSLPVPEEIGKRVAAFFGLDVRLAVRSSANGEDLENLAGAGLYESVVNVSAAQVSEAIRQVWASLWTRRAALSRSQAGIAHERIHMAVLLQELIAPDLSFILHTANPLTGNRDEVLAELAVGLGEVLASAPLPGTPYRLKCARRTGAVELAACATFSFALRPSAQGSIVQDRLDYSRIALSTDPDLAAQLGKRFAALATVLEEALGGPQDVEGVIAGDEMYVVQSRPQQGLSESRPQ